MRKRLRKKRHLGEFTVYGFELTFRLNADLSSDEREHFFDRFIAEAIEGNDLLFGGGGAGDSWSGFAVTDRARTATDAHRNAVERWLASSDVVVDIHIGPLRDAWHDWDDELEGSLPQTRCGSRPPLQ